MAVLIETAAEVLKLSALPLAFVSIVLVALELLLIR
jgi:hypothetical protein